MKGIHYQECASFVNERLAVCARATRMSSKFANRKVTCSRIKMNLGEDAFSRQPSRDHPSPMSQMDCRWRAGSAARFVRFRQAHAASRRRAYLIPAIVKSHLFHCRLFGLHELDDRLIDRHVPAEITDLFFQPFGAEQITHSRVSFYDPEFDSAGCQLPMQRR